MRILLTNDDGIQAIGIQAMHRALTDAGHAVQVVAPVTEQSAVGHAVTMSAPLRVREFADGQFRGYGVQGTPVDCVKLALATLLRETPDLVVSGINAGANVGVDILYSGTVAAATDAALMGFPALAVSYDGFNPTDLSEQAAYAARLIPQLPWPDLPPQCVLNLNFPAVPLERAAPLACCPQTSAAYDDWFEERTDPRGRTYYWMVGAIPAARVGPGTDRDLLTRGHITLTPLRFDFTDPGTLAMLRSRV